MVPKPLSSRLEPFVDPKVRQRGWEYYILRRVALGANVSGELLATVRGTANYSVRLRREGPRIEAACDCPFFTDRAEICKHVWGVVLTLEQRPDLGWTQGELPRFLAVAGSSRPRTAIDPIPPWRRVLEAVSAETAPRIATGDLLYLVDVDSTLARHELVVEILARRRRADGAPGALQTPRLTRGEVGRLADPAERRILSLLVAGPALSPLAGYFYGAPSSERSPIPTRCQVPEALAELLVPLLCATGRCRLRLAPGGELGEPLAWDEGPPWQFRVAVTPSADGTWEVTGELHRGDEVQPIGEPVLLLRSGLVFYGDRAARLDAGDAFGWISLLRRPGRLRVPAADGEELAERLATALDAGRLALPESLRIEQASPAPRPHLKLLPPADRERRGEWLRADLSFDYEGRWADFRAPGGGLYDREARRVLRRDPAAESRVADRLWELGLQASPDGLAGRWQVQPRRVPALVRTLLGEGWTVEAEGGLYRSPGAFRVSVTSGIDWFEVDGAVDFGGVTARLPELLAALRRGEGFVTLGDGSFGLLPEEWLKRIAPVASLGEAGDGRLKFRAAHASLLDAWLTAEPEATWDETFARARRRLQRFEGVAPADAPPGFVGELREYQRAGLGWLHFLRELGFGGCLADDMGLGKTVQVLALLASRHAENPEGEAGGEGREPGPSLVVVPRSLLFNWLAEAARFTPGLKVLDYTGPERKSRGDRENGEKGDPFAGHDLVLTTYGTMRREVAALREVEFDYLVLDEAQAIKNADSQTAKCARLLRGRHRLALTGTPVENHLGELWSLLEFLNPGLSGAAAFRRAGSGLRDLRDPREADAEGRRLLARALRPFLLRRTKEQVAAELPAKVEQTLFCELPAKQRKLYDELRGHYRRELGTRIGERGLARSKILVLEALLRLRQAACHPALLDPRRAGEPSAKLDLLLPQLREILEEGHKALVFSQFTSFLALLRRQLDGEGLPYVYLDGRTRDRRERVERFQTDPGAKLFLISLKAGGLGLNLTAADYVYLLDPWWNPAVEAQAVDRAHRIGQTRPVFASRIVARDTVEEKILELQKAKRELADAIVKADESLVAGLSPEDLELLLS